MDFGIDTLTAIVAVLMLLVLGLNFVAPKTKTPIDDFIAKYLGKVLAHLGFDLNITGVASFKKALEENVKDVEEAKEKVKKLKAEIKSLKTKKKAKK